MSDDYKSYETALTFIAHQRVEAVKEQGWLDIYLGFSKRPKDRLKPLCNLFDERAQALNKYFLTFNTKKRIQVLAHDLEDYNSFGHNPVFGENNYSLFHLLMIENSGGDMSRLITIVQLALDPDSVPENMYESVPFDDMTEKEYHEMLCRRLDRLIRISEDELVVALASRLLHEATLQDTLPDEKDNKESLCECPHCPPHSATKDNGDRMWHAFGALLPDFYHVDKLLMELSPDKPKKIRRPKVSADHQDESHDSQTAIDYQAEKRRFADEWDDDDDYDWDY